jgi:hypothetical protein
MIQYSVFHIEGVSREGKEWEGKQKEQESFWEETEPGVAGGGVGVGEGESDGG